MISRSRLAVAEASLAELAFIVMIALAMLLVLATRDRDEAQKELASTQAALQAALPPPEPEPIDASPEGDELLSEVIDDDVEGGPAPSDDWTELTSDADGSELTEDEDYLAEEDLQSEEIAALGEDPNEHEGPGTGRDKEPCWKKEEAPGYDYLLTISITSDGLVVEPRWPLGRDPEAQAMAQRLTPIVGSHSAQQFLVVSGPLFESFPECRHYAVLTDDSSVSDLTVRAYKEMAWAVDQRFYKRDDRQLVSDR